MEMKALAALWMEMTPKAVVTQVAVAQAQVAQAQVAMMPKAVGPLLMLRMLRTSLLLRAVHSWPILIVCAHELGLVVEG